MGSFVLKINLKRTIALTGISLLDAFFISGTLLLLHMKDPNWVWQLPIWSAAIFLCATLSLLAWLWIESHRNLLRWWHPILLGFVWFLQFVLFLLLFFPLLGAIGGFLFVSHYLFLAILCCTPINLIVYAKWLRSRKRPHFA